ncbi:ubiquitin carboxyl-terminal hydrolase [Mortierella sp. AD032]|nr:ubiquitin carboxyl-terminal hydrolase [Mortierella sp. AD032]
MWRNGIRGAHVQELYSLDHHTFRELARQPVYGFIFLIKPQGSRLSKVQSLAQQPDFSNVYFAKQVIPNACGTQAILSIALNSHENHYGNDDDDDGLDIGPLLRNFKEFTAGFSPLNKGLTMTNCIQLRDNHNSSAGQYEQSLPDLPLSFFPLPNQIDLSSTKPSTPIKHVSVRKSSDATDGPRDKRLSNNSTKRSEQKPPKKRSRGAKHKGGLPPPPDTVSSIPPVNASIANDASASNSSNNGSKGHEIAQDDDYHYVAYVHVDGYIWELDGLQPEPIRLAACKKDCWVNEARLEFMARVLSFEDDEQSFVLMAMTKDPLVTLSQRIHSS